MKEDMSSQSQPSGLAASQHSSGLDAVPSAAFTPGPWSITSQDGGDFDVTAPDGDEDPWNIAVVVGACGYPDDPRTGTTENNARLIAAAPDLLDALQNLLKVHECEGGTRYHAGDIARAAIAKALGASTASPADRQGQVPGMNQ